MTTQAQLLQEQYDQGYDDYEPQGPQLPQYMLPPMQQPGSNIPLLTDPTNELHNFELTLRGMVELSDGTTMQLKEPLMNEVGVSAMIGHLRAIVNRVTILTHTSPNDIRIVLDTMIPEVIIPDLMMNVGKYAIAQPTNTTRSYILGTITSMDFLCLKRSENGGERSFLKGSMQDMRIVSEQNSNSKGGIIGKVASLWGMGKK